MGTGGTAADALDPEAFDTARTRLATGPNLGLAHLTNGLERIEAGAAGFARAARNGVSNINIRGAATPPPLPPLPASEEVGVGELKLVTALVAASVVLWGTPMEGQ